MIPNVCRLDRTATIRIGFLQMTPNVAQPMVIVLIPVPDFTVRKAPALILFILSSAKLMQSTSLMACLLIAIDL